MRPGGESAGQTDGLEQTDALLDADVCSLDVFSHPFNKHCCSWSPPTPRSPLQSLNQQHWRAGGLETAGVASGLHLALQKGRLGG